jgi:hypothetical protein
MADLYASMTAAQQASFRSALYSKISQSSCPTVDLSGAGITGPDSLSDADNRGIALDCFQTANRVGAGGVLDHATLTAVLGGMPTWEKIAMWGAAAFAALWALGKLGGKRSRRR